MAKITSKGQVVIPQEIRKKVGLKPGDLVEFEVEGDRIIIKPLITVPRSQAWFWTEKWQRLERKAEEDMKKGRTEAFENLDDLFEDLDS